MSNTITTVEPTAELEAVAPTGAPSIRRRLERGLATVEYAVGIVLVLTVVGALVWSAQQGWFKDLVKALFETIFRLVTQHLAG